MARIYFYKLTCDDGGAPCVRDGLLSLAICKPMIRRMAEPDDLIFGFAANSLQRDNALLYIAVVTHKACDGAYYRERQFARREDCIYRWSGSRFRWRQDAPYHGPRHLRHDLGEHPEYKRAQVILSGDFRYFGCNGSSDYKREFHRIAAAVETLGQGHRIHHVGYLERELLALKHQVWRRTRRRMLGEAISLPQLDVSHRGGSCRILDCDGC